MLSFIDHEKGIMEIVCEDSLFRIKKKKTGWDFLGYLFTGLL